MSSSCPARHSEQFDSDFFSVNHHHHLWHSAFCSTIQKQTLKLDLLTKLLTSYGLFEISKFRGSTWQCTVKSRCYFRNSKEVARYSHSIGLHQVIFLIYGSRHSQKALRVGLSLDLTLKGLVVEVHQENRSENRSIVLAIVSSALICI